MTIPPSSRNGVIASHIPGGSKTSLASPENRNIADLSAGDFPGVGARARRPPSIAGGQRSPFSKPTARPSRPLAGGKDRARRGGCPCSSLDCPCFARRYMALAPFDLRGGLVRSSLSRRSLNGPLWSGPPRRLLEQQSQEPPRRESQQEQPSQPEQQYRLPVGQNVFRRSRRDQGPGGRACYVQDRS